MAPNKTNHANKNTVNSKAQKILELNTYRATTLANVNKAMVPKITAIKFSSIRSTHELSSFMIAPEISDLNKEGALITQRANCFSLPY